MEVNKSQNIAIDATGEIYEGKSASLRFIRVIRVAIDATREIYEGKSA